MKKIIEEKKEINIVKETDVVVIGGGLAGVAAAVAARRNGAEVTLIEKSIVLGGLATAGLVCIYLPIDDGAGNKVYGGLTEELLHTSIKYGYDNLPDCWRDKPMRVENPTGRYRTNFNIPAAIFALDELTQNEGIDVVFDSVFCAPIMEGNTVKGVIVENKSGRTAYMAKMFIDASGDSDLLYRAGADTETNEKNIVSSWTHELDFETMQKGIANEDMIKAAPLRWFGLRPDVDNSAATIPMFDGTTSEGVNGYIRVSRKLMLDYLKKNQRESYCMMTVPFQPQFRMSRHLIGKDALHLDVPCAYVEHSIGCVIQCLDNPAAAYEFPYEGLITDKLTNVAAAGRMVSASGKAWEIMRNIPGCVLTGEAAGTAAALAVKDNCDLQTIDVAKLQDILIANGNILHCTEEMKKVKAVEFDVSRDPKKVVATEGIKIDTLAYSDKKTGH